MQAPDLLPQISSARSRKPSDGRPEGFVRAYRSADAETIVVALGLVLGTIEEVVDEPRGGHAHRRSE